MKRKKFPMTLQQAEEIHRRTSLLRMKTQFTYYRRGYEFLLRTVYSMEKMINSLKMNNRALAEAVAVERQTSSTHLQDKLSTEKLYFDLIEEHSILKTNLYNIEQQIVFLDQDVSSSLIPNLVQFSEDISNVKMRCVGLKNIIQSTKAERTPTTVYRRPEQTHKNKPPTFTPILEENESECGQVMTRKCKGGLRNIRNTHNIQNNKNRLNKLSLSPNSFKFMEVQKRNECHSDSLPLDISDDQILSSKGSKTLNDAACIIETEDEESEKENQLNQSNIMDFQEYQKNITPILPSPKIVLRRISNKKGSMNDSLHSINELNETKIILRRSSRLSLKEQQYEQSTTRRSARSFSTEPNHESFNDEVSEHKRQLDNSWDDNKRTVFISDRKRSSRKKSLSKSSKKSNRFFSMLCYSPEFNVNDTLQTENSNKMSNTLNEFRSDSEIDNASIGKTRLRARPNISYKEPPLNAKLRK